MFNVYKNQLSRQTGSRNLTGPKKLPTIWHTYRYMKLVTKYQISAINSCWEKCDEKYLGRTDRGKTVYPPLVERVCIPKRGYKNNRKSAEQMKTFISVKNLFFQQEIICISLPSLLHQTIRHVCPNLTYFFTDVEVLINKFLFAQTSPTSKKDVYSNFFFFLQKQVCFVFVLNSGYFLVP